MVDVAQLVEPWIVIPVVVGSSPIIHPSFGPLAQLVEQVTLNHLVVGSNPTRPTICPGSRLLSLSAPGCGGLYPVDCPDFLPAQVLLQRGDSPGRWLFLTSKTGPANGQKNAPHP